MSKTPPVTDTEDFWDQRYSSAPALWSGQPNPHLLEEASDLQPGSAIDVGAGEGADAIWLAEHGWTVTAVDVSGVALDRGATQADTLGPAVAQRISWKKVDLSAWTPEPASFDLVSAHFLHLPSSERRTIYRGLMNAVAPGGTLLIVGHHPSDLSTTIQRPPTPDLLFTPDDITDDLDEGWTIVVADAQPREAIDSEGTPTTIHDTVVRAFRNP